MSFTVCRSSQFAFLLFKDLSELIMDVYYCCELLYCVLLLLLLLLLLLPLLLILLQQLLLLLLLLQLVFFCLWTSNRSNNIYISSLSDCQAVRQALDISTRASACWAQMTAMSPVTPAWPPGGYIFRRLQVFGFSFLLAIARQEYMDWIWATAVASQLLFASHVQPHAITVGVTICSSSERLWAARYLI